MNAPIQPRMFCYDNDAKQNHSLRVKKFYRAAAKQLPGGYVLKSHFNPGGIAVWGETYAKIYFNNKPVIEAFDTPQGLLVRQWDGRNSGRNYYTVDLDGFVQLITGLATLPFVRF